MKYFLLFCSIFLCFGAVRSDNNIDTGKIYIHQIPDKISIIKAVNIIINTLDKQKIYTKQEMLGVINNGMDIKSGCKEQKYYLIINFTRGVWSNKYKRFCLFSDSEKLKNICLLGLFNGHHTINIIIGESDKIHNTAFAHELLHYFRRHVDGPSMKGHIPKEFWADLVGFEVDGIGILNEELKKAGL